MMWPPTSAPLIEDRITNIKLLLTPGFNAFVGPKQSLSVRTPNGVFFDVPSIKDPIHGLTELAGDSLGTLNDSVISERTARAMADAGMIAEQRLPTPLTFWLLSDSNEVRDCFLSSRFGSVNSVSELALSQLVRLRTQLSLPSNEEATRQSPTEKLPPTQSACSPDAVIWYSDQPAPASWLAIGDQLPKLGIGWIRASREGNLVYVEPPAWTNGDVLHSDVRHRRLAASPSPMHLAHFWRNELTTKHGTLPATAPNLIAGLLSTIAQRPGEPLTTLLPGVGDSQSSAIPSSRLLIADLATGVVSAHTILAIPRGKGVAE